MAKDKTELPLNVINLLKNGKFVHLGTASKDAIPDVTLMNYYYISKSDLYTSTASSTSSEDRLVDHTYIALSTSKNSLKFKNLLENPNVSLLVHDWTFAKGKFDVDSQAERSSLWRMLTSLNQSELSNLSATFTGKANILDNGPELSYYKDLLMKENPDAKVYIEGDDNRIVLVQISSAKVCDNENRQSVYEP